MATKLFFNRKDLNPKHEIRNSKQSQMTKLKMFETDKSLRHLDFEHLNLFRLPARSRFGEGRDFDIRISDFSQNQTLFGSSYAGLGG